MLVLYKVPVLYEVRWSASFVKTSYGWWQSCLQGISPFWYGTSSRYKRYTGISWITENFQSLKIMHYLETKITSNERNSQKYWILAPKLTAVKHFLKTFFLTALILFLTKIPLSRHGKIGPNKISITLSADIK